MKEVIYLSVSRQGVSKMTKNLPQLGRGEIPVKLIIEVADGAFGSPVLEQHVKVVDWRQGIDIADVRMTEATITQAEAELIRAQRLAAMRAVLEGQGYIITPPEVTDAT